MCDDSNRQFYPTMWHGIIPPCINDGSYIITSGSSTATSYQPWQLHKNDDD